VELTVCALAVQSDGKIVVGGLFNTLGGHVRYSIGRLNADATLDTTFDPNANGIVYALAVQSDGKLVLGGYFTALGGQTRDYIGRLNADGTLDTTFTPEADDERAVYALAVQSDGKIVVGASSPRWAGRRATVSGAQRRRHARHHLQPRRERLCLRPRGAVGWQARGGGLVHHAGRADA